MGIRYKLIELYVTYTEKRRTYALSGPQLFSIIRTQHKELVIGYSIQSHLYVEDTILKVYTLYPWVSLSVYNLWPVPRAEFWLMLES